MTPYWSDDDELRLSGANADMRSAVRRFNTDGVARNYVQAHLVARWLLGLLKSDPAALCHDCGISEAGLRGLVSQMHAALNWPGVSPERLRADYAGKIFSIRPDLDYIALCASCHRRLDSWRRALPQGIAAA